MNVIFISKLYIDVQMIHNDKQFSPTDSGLGFPLKKFILKVHYRKVSIIKRPFVDHWDWKLTLGNSIL